MTIAVVLAKVETRLQVTAAFSAITSSLELKMARKLILAKRERFVQTGIYRVYFMTYRQASR